MAVLTVAMVPLNFTVLLAIVGEKLEPVRVTTVPAVPVVGEKLVMDKAATGATIVKSLEEIAIWLSTSTEIFPVVAYLLRYPTFPSRPVRLLGVSLSNLDHDTNSQPYQLPLPFSN